MIMRDRDRDEQNMGGDLESESLFSFLNYKPVMT